MADAQDARDLDPISIPRGVPCPALRASVRGELVTLDGRARVGDLDQLDVRLRCRYRPGVALAADYVLDLCLGRTYPVADCLFRWPGTAEMPAGAGATPGSGRAGPR